MNVDRRLRNRIVAKLVCATMFSSFTLGAAPISGSSQPTAVDSTQPSARFCRGTVAISYSPKYVDASAADTAYVVIRKVDVATATTNLLVRCELGEGTYDFTPGTADSHCERLLMTAYDATNLEIGSTLVADLVTPLASGSSAEVKVDARVASLQELAEAGARVALAYDTRWVTNGVPASVKISCERVCRRKSGAFVSAETNDLLVANAPATGDCMHPVKASHGGLFTFRCAFLDEDGISVCEDLVASYELPLVFGSLIFIK